LPLLLTALLIGFVVSLFQAVSSVQEQTLAAVPKMIGVFAVMIMLGPWYLNRLLEFITYVFTNIPNFMIR
jgi:flagellar biosynthetic protein FliQ